MITKKETLRWSMAMGVLLRICEDHNWTGTSNRLLDVSEVFYKRLAKGVKKGKSIDDVIAETDDDSGDEEVSDD